jgi:hypothetical protein
MNIQTKKEKEIQKLFEYALSYSILAANPYKYSKPGEMLMHVKKIFKLETLKDLKAEDLLKYLRIEDFKKLGLLDKDIHEPTYVRNDKEKFWKWVNKKKT